MKNNKGTVAVVLRRNTLAIQLPRNLFNGKQTYIYLGLPDTPTNRKAAEARANAIASDIAFDRFDATLERYRPTATNDNSPTLLELWDKYAAYKAKHLSKTTIDKDFKRIRNHITEFPGQRLTDARRIKSYLAEKFTADTAKKTLMYVKACCDWAVYYFNNTHLIIRQAIIVTTIADAITSHSVKVRCFKNTINFFIVQKLIIR